ncbi:MAG TPA: SDR family oxidoreductase [Frankiaceae bacterium]|jgi:NAD(P)-dependent dehydrogenase (short-subunit alcohol dehydrogenase family)|nr:SDR family oxidoreductase [Frankiaceae bacterium]
MSIAIDLSGQGALVTGSGAGIGREIARWLARAGAAVVVHDIRREKADAVVKEIESEGGAAHAVLADARDDDALAAMVEEAGQLLGRLDVAVNNVGNYASQKPGAFVTLDGAHWRDLVNQNLIVTALSGAAEARVMLRGGRPGLIVNITSGETTRPSPRMSAYGASKAAINHLTQSMAVELGPSGIRVVALAPGTTLTETIAPVFDDEHMAALVAATPLQRMTEHDELARLVVFMASDLARCVTGQVILADAGAFLSRSRPQNKM